MRAMRVVLGAVTLTAAVATLATSAEVVGAAPGPGPDTDWDHDGLSQDAEVRVLHTDPRDPDSDDDRLCDGVDVDLDGPDGPGVDVDLDGPDDCGGVDVDLGTNPLDPDSDDDGLSDGFEHFDHHTNPLYKDSDGDGIPDNRDDDRP